MKTYSLSKLQREYFKAQQERLHKDHEGIVCNTCWTPLPDSYCYKCDQQVDTEQDSFLNLTAEEFKAV
ncbi:hypothetical protein [uncultured Metabacillus sp.]|uniref:hypothetical protein n=1 Tax=uncultured Metabacillus sp. TaxID=2860135 RepID=UPI00261CFF96|nr:hypothetical protein [uncultured Metabacillus sp.]